jgi:hypothetical protein
LTAGTQPVGSLPEPARTATRDEETRHLVSLYAGDAAKIMGAIESQLSILAARAQTLLSLAGITVTVTGFSGANIARSGRVAAMLLVSGLGVVLVSAAVAMVGILHVRWVTSLPPCSLELTIQNALEIRDTKTRRFSAALTLLVVGLTLYGASVGLLLLGSLPK